MSSTRTVAMRFFFTPSVFLPPLLLMLMSTAGASLMATKTPLQVALAQALIETAFSIKPLYKAISAKAREGIINQGASMGVDWGAEVAAYERQREVLDRHYASLVNANVGMPDYYLRPFHAYDEGNLSWQCAMEVGAAALTVHSNIYTPNRQTLEIEGDDKLRSSFINCVCEALARDGRGFAPTKILDCGCSTGLSTLKLAESFPNAREIIGLDLSAYMLSVAVLDLNSKDEATKRRITYLHGAAEATSLGERDVDMVCLSLVSHELPASASAAAFREAYRLLPSGGCLALMDIDPQSESFQRLASNPFGFAAFTSTEPWLAEYIALPLQAELQSVGFVDVSTRSNSPRHRTVVAWKH